VLRLTLGSAAAAGIPGRTFAAPVDLQSLSLSHPDSQAQVSDNPLAPIGGNLARYAQIGPYGLADEPTYFATTLGGKPRRVFYYLPARLSSDLPALYFSHDIGLSPQLHKRLLMRIASHGFVVIAPVHEDSSFFDGPLANSADVMNPTLWDNRVDDMEELLRNARTFSSQTHVDISRRPVGIMGVGYGAMIAAYMAGGALAGGKRWGYDVFSYLVAVAPLTVPISYAYTPADLFGSQKPMLVSTGSGLRDRFGDDPARQVGMIPGSKGSLHTLSWFQSVTEGTFSLAPRDTDDLTPYLYLSLLAEFCSICARIDTSARGDLLSDYYQKATNGQLTINTI